MVLFGGLQRFLRISPRSDLIISFVPRCRTGIRGSAPERYEEGPTGLIAASALDALIDGLVLGLGFNAGAKQGLLLAIALAIEFLFLALSIAGAFAKGRSRWAVIGTATGVSLAVPLRVGLSRPVRGLPETWQAVAFAFGLVALLYLAPKSC